MLKSQSLKLPCLLFTISVLLVITVFGLFGDILFFRSDMVSAFIVVVAISGMVFVFVFIVCGGIMALSPRFYENALSYVGHVLVSLIIVNTVYFLLNIIDVKFLVTVRVKRLLFPNIPAFYPEFLWLVFWCVLLVVVFYKLSKASGKETFVHRGSVVALVATPVILFLFVGVVGYGGSGRLNVDAGVMKMPRQVVLIVLDGWPSQYMKAFNPQAGAKPGDGTIAQGLVFRNVRTNCVWTTCYFGTLYLGSPQLAFSHENWRIRSRIWAQAFDTKENLIGVLQRNGVQVRTFHAYRMGLPEGSAASVSNYKGFRSIFLSSLYMPFLDALRVQYSMQFTGPSQETLDEDMRRHILNKLLPSPPRLSDYTNVLTELLIPEMQRMLNTSEESLIIFHTGWTLGSRTLAKAFDGNSSKGEDLVAKKARLQDYRYGLEDEWYAKSVRFEYDLSTEAVEAKIGRFIGKLEEEGLLEHTLLIFTADHGSMSAKGKLWYGFHPDEEVMRVPLVIFGGGRSGVEERNFETIDITQTLLAHFGISKNFHPRARSLFENGKKPFTASFTLRSNVNSEWYIALYKGDRKYLFNIHPDGNGQGIEQTINRFDTVTVSEGYDVIREVLPEFVQTLSEFGLVEIPDKDIHPNYRKARLLELAKTGH